MFHSGLNNFNTLESMEANDRVTTFKVTTSRIGNSMEINEKQFLETSLMIHHNNGDGGDSYHDHSNSEYQLNGYQQQQQHRESFYHDRTRSITELEYYSDYDPMVGYRIAITLGLLILFFTLFVMYKTHCHRQKNKRLVKNAQNVAIATSQLQHMVNVDL